MAGNAGKGEIGVTFGEGAETASRSSFGKSDAGVLNAFNCNGIRGYGGFPVLNG